MKFTRLLNQEVKVAHLPIVYLIVSFLGHLVGVLFPPSVEVYGGGANAYKSIENLSYFFETFFVIPFGQGLSLFGAGMLDNDLGVYFSLAAMISLGSAILFVSTKKLMFLVLFALCLFIISVRALYFTNMGMGV